MPPKRSPRQRAERASEWLLVDYGNVISRPQSPRDVARMAARAGLDVRRFRAAYWRHRDAYDRGLPAPAYWSRVMGRPLADSDPVVGELSRLDTASWSRVNPATLLVLHQLAGRGQRLALLSNAPEPLAASLDAAPWAELLENRFYSCRLGVAKPDAAIFVRVFAAIGADAAAVTFVDDRPEHVRAAAALGAGTVRFRSPAALARRLLRP